MESDVHAPEKYGIYQSVRYNRSWWSNKVTTNIPMFVEIAEAIKEYCPDAWVIITNPMVTSVQTLYKVFLKSRLDVAMKCLNPETFS